MNITRMTAPQKAREAQWNKAIISLRSKAAGFLRKTGKSYSSGAKTGGKLLGDTYKSIGNTAKSIAMKHTPVGVVASAIGLAKDKKAEKASKASAYKLHERLNNVRQNRSKAAKTLRKFKFNKYFDITKTLAKPMNYIPRSK